MAQELKTYFKRDTQKYSLPPSSYTFLLTDTENSFVFLIIIFNDNSHKNGEDTHRNKKNFHIRGAETDLVQGK